MVKTPAQEGSEPREVRLSQVLDHLHPSFREPLRQVGARVYALSVSGGPSVPVAARLYVSFLTALCDLGYQVFVDHDVRFLSEEHKAELVRLLQGVEPSTRFVILTRKDLRRMGVRHRSLLNELMFTTRSRSALRILFEHGDMFGDFGNDWLLGRLDSPYPLESLRQLNLGRDPSLAMPSAVREFPAMFQTREFHGPLVATIHLGHEQVVSAAEQTASELGFPLLSE